MCVCVVLLARKRLPMFACVRVRLCGRACAHEPRVCVCVPQGSADPSAPLSRTGRWSTLSSWPPCGRWPQTGPRTASRRMTSSRRAAAELVGCEKVGKWIQVFFSASQWDIIVFSNPPFLFLFSTPFCSLLLSHSGLVLAFHVFPALQSSPLPQAQGDSGRLEATQVF